MTNIQLAPYRSSRYGASAARLPNEATKLPDSACRKAPSKACPHDLNLARVSEASGSGLVVTPGPSCTTLWAGGAVGAAQAVHRLCARARPPAAGEGWARLYAAPGWDRASSTAARSQRSTVRCGSVRLGARSSHVLVEHAVGACHCRTEEAVMAKQAENPVERLLRMNEDKVKCVDTLGAARDALDVAIVEYRAAWKSARDAGWAKNDLVRAGFKDATTLPRVAAVESSYASTSSGDERTAE